jgi:hypothetical protein
MLPGDSTHDAKWRCEYCRAGNGGPKGQFQRVCLAMQMQYSGRDYMPMLNIYLKECLNNDGDNQVPAHRTTKYPK